MRQFDFLIVGGGIVGLSISLSLRKRYPDATIAILEKEKTLAQHASTRNSGVLHAGFYYSPDSLKAKLTVQGNLLLSEFCQENAIPLLRCGKVVVAQQESQVPALETLFDRGQKNGVQVELVTPSELHRIEPLARTVEKALWSPNTGVSDPKLVASAFEKQARAAKVEIFTDQKVEKIDDNYVTSSRGEKFGFAHLVNCSGLYADKIAKKMGFGNQYSMIPFIGLYYYAPSLRGSLKTHIYPTPDPRNPFLGVHFTKTSSDDVKVGPTAIPLLSREQYGFFEGLQISEFAELLVNYPKFLFSKAHDSWSLIRTELPKISRTLLLRQARPLSDKINLEAFTKRGRPGIRAQLFDLDNRKLEMDFVVQGDKTSTHVLNAVSPGWTTCISFANHVVSEISERISE
jgi:L-2-hydroxyglutarate oxidase LhgO